jgi:predicted RNA binding protein YcfA (HicA-like mRNA interferase family)
MHEFSADYVHLSNGPDTAGHHALRIGWTIKREAGSHRSLARSGYPDYVFAFHENEEIGPRMLVRIAKHTGLAVDDL